MVMCCRCTFCYIQSCASSLVFSIPHPKVLFTTSTPRLRNSRQAFLVDRMERAALVALFRATDGANWKRNNNWNTDAGLSSWYGVQVNDQGSVVELTLYENDFKGKSLHAILKRFSAKILSSHQRSTTIGSSTSHIKPIYPSKDVAARVYTVKVLELAGG